jgi:hypothetical protein
MGPFIEFYGWSLAVLLAKTIRNASIVSKTERLAGVVADFQTAATEDIDAFASHFVSRDDVKEAVMSNQDIAEEMTRNCLERYGATL